MTDLVFAYDRLGAMKTVTDATGKRTFHFRASDHRLEYVDWVSGQDSFYGPGRRLTMEYNTARFREGFLFGNSTSSAAYDDYYRSEWVRNNGRISQIKAYDRGSDTSFRPFDYTFATNSNLISSLTTPDVNGTSDWVQTTAYRSYENRAQSFSSKVGSSTYSYTGFAYDEMGRITAASSWGTLFSGFGAYGALNYTYDYWEDGRLKNALGATTDSSDDPVPMNSRRFYYGYDHAGNQDWSSQWADGDVPANADYKKSYNPDAANALEEIDLAKMDVFSGEVSGTPSVFDGERPGWIPLAELPKPGYGSVFEHKFDITLGNDTGSPFDRRFYFSNPYLRWNYWKYPQKIFSPTYDKDGNLLTDGLFTYTYDLENRMISIEQGPYSFKQRLEFKYDYMGRRVEATFKTFADADGYWTTEWTKRFVYDGWHCIAELSGETSPTVTQTYFWGYDISGTIGGAGTIGGLLLVDDGTDQYLPGYDGRGNVVMLIDESDGAMVAEFEYDPYGRTLRKEGAYDKIPFRYQTKWDIGFGSEDNSLAYQWKLLDYGLRWSSPETGRFINRDPIGEAGGNNLYEAFGGDPVNRYDFLGLDMMGTDLSYLLNPRKRKPAEDHRKRRERRERRRLDLLNKAREEGANIVTVTFKDGTQKKFLFTDADAEKFREIVVGGTSGGSTSSNNRIDFVDDTPGSGPSGSTGGGDLVFGDPATDKAIELAPLHVEESPDSGILWTTGNRLHYDFSRGMWIRKRFGFMGVIELDSLTVSTQSGDPENFTLRRKETSLTVFYAQSDLTPVTWLNALIDARKLLSPETRHEEFKLDSVLLTAGEVPVDYVEVAKRIKAVNVLESYVQDPRPFSVGYIINGNPMVIGFIPWEHLDLLESFGKSTNGIGKLYLFERIYEIEYIPRSNP